MRVPERVLHLAGGLSRELGAVYGMVRRLDEGAPRAGGFVATVQEGVDALWGRLRAVRCEMSRAVGSRADCVRCGVR